MLDTHVHLQVYYKRGDVPDLRAYETRLLDIRFSLRHPCLNNRSRASTLWHIAHDIHQQSFVNAGRSCRFQAVCTHSPSRRF